MSYESENNKCIPNSKLDYMKTLKESSDHTLYDNLIAYYKLCADLLSRGEYDEHKSEYVLMVDGILKGYYKSLCDANIANTGTGTGTDTILIKKVSDYPEEIVEDKTVEDKNECNFDLGTFTINDTSYVLGYNYKIDTTVDVGKLSKTSEPKPFNYYNIPCKVLSAAMVMSQFETINASSILLSLFTYSVGDTLFPVLACTFCMKYYMSV